MISQACSEMYKDHGAERRDAVLDFSSLNYFIGPWDLAFCINSAVHLFP